MADIRIDRYEVDVASNGQTQAITDVGSLSSAFVRLVGSSIKASGGPTGSGGNSAPTVVGCGVQLTATNELTFYIPNTTARKIMVEVWSYTGSPGGAYEFISRQRGSVTISSGLSNSVALAGLGSRNNVVPFYTGWSSTEGANNDFHSAVFAAHVNASNDLVFSRNNADAPTHVAYYDAVEFTGSGWRVGHGVSSAHDTGNDVDGTGGETITLNTDSTGAGGSAFDTTDWGTAMVVEGTMEGDSGETGLSDCQMVFRPETDTSQIRCTLDNTSSRNDGTAYCHVIQCDDLVVSRDFTYNFAEGTGGANYGSPLSVPAGTNASTPLTEAALEWFVCTSGEGTAWARGCLVAQLTAMTGTGIQHWVHRSGNNVSASYAIADFSAMVDAGGTTNYDETASATANATAGANGTYAVNYQETASATASAAASATESYALDFSETASASANVTAGAQQSYQRDYPETASASANATASALGSYSVDFTETASAVADATSGATEGYAVGFTGTASASADATAGADGSFAIDFAGTASASADATAGADGDFEIIFNETASASADASAGAQQSFAVNYPESASATANATASGNGSYDSGSSSNDYFETASASINITADAIHQYEVDYTESASATANLTASALGVYYVPGSAPVGGNRALGMASLGTQCLNRALNMASLGLFCDGMDLTQFWREVVSFDLSLARTYAVSLER